jgi:hypothetical protein
VLERGDRGVGDVVRDEIASDSRLYSSTTCRI